MRTGSRPIREGFGLLEILVALGLLAVAMPAVATMTEQGSRTVRWTELEAMAVLRAAAELDREAARPFDELLKDCEVAPVIEEQDAIQGQAMPFYRTLERARADDGLVTLRMTVRFELPRAGKRPVHVVELKRVVGRPDQSVAMAVVGC